MAIRCGREAHGHRVLACAGPATSPCRSLSCLKCPHPLPSCLPSPFEPAANMATLGLSSRAGWHGSAFALSQCSRNGRQPVQRPRLHVRAAGGETEPDLSRQFSEFKKRMKASMPEVEQRTITAPPPRCSLRGVLPACAVAPPYHHRPACHGELRAFALRRSLLLQPQVFIHSQGRLERWSPCRQAAAAGARCAGCLDAGARHAVCSGGHHGPRAGPALCRGWAAL